MVSEPNTDGLFYGLNICIPTNSHVEILTSHVTVLGGRAFGSLLGYEGGALLNGFRALIKDKRWFASLLLSAMWGYNEKTAPSPNQEPSPHQTLGLLTP